MTAKRLIWSALASVGLLAGMASQTAHSPPATVLAASDVSLERAFQVRASRSAFLPLDGPSTTTSTSPPPPPSTTTTAPPPSTTTTTRPPRPTTTTTAAPAASQGGLPAGLLCIRHRESTDNYRDRTGNGYYGAYQYDVSTWAHYGGFTYPSDAPPSVQDAKALAGYNEGPAGRHRLWPRTSRACGV